MIQPVLSFLMDKVIIIMSNFLILHILQSGLGTSWRNMLPAVMWSVAEPGAVLKKVGLLNGRKASVVVTLITWYF